MRRQNKLWPEDCGFFLLAALVTDVARTVSSSGCSETEHRAHFALLHTQPSFISKHPFLTGIKNAIWGGILRRAAILRYVFYPPKPQTAQRPKTPDDVPLGPLTAQAIGYFPLSKVLRLTLTCGPLVCRHLLRRRQPSHTHITHCCIFVTLLTPAICNFIYSKNTTSANKRRDVSVVNKFLISLI